MKRSGDLYRQICDPDNLRLAFYKASKAKLNKHSVRDYEMNLDYNLHTLYNQLYSGDVDVGGYRLFKIYEPKERIISAVPFEQRVLHHAIMNICHQVFERQQIYHSYATRKGKGQFAALSYAASNQNIFKWFIKLDIKKYFDSISHPVLMEKLSRKFKDKKVLRLFQLIIESYETTKGAGLPIGNLTSQYFANFYLSWADHHLLEKIGIGSYVRYMDDMVLWHDDKDMLLDRANLFIGFIEQQLNLELKPICMHKTVKGLPFLGYVLFPSKIRLNKQSKIRFNKKLRQANVNLASGFWSQGEYANHILPLLGFVRKADTHDLRYRLLYSRQETGFE